MACCRSGGVTDDIRCGLSYLSHAVPGAPLYGIGFSLGANQMAKLAGEDGEGCPLKTVLPVCAPFDFLAGHQKISSSWLHQVYSKAMGNNMRVLVTKHQRWLAKRVNFADLHFNKNLTLFEFDSLATTQVGERAYGNAYDFYRDASSARVVAGVRIPFLSLAAADDPIVATEADPHAKAQANPWLVYATFKHGGHLGFFGSRFGFLEFFRPRRGIARPALEWLRAVEAADGGARLAYRTSPAPAVDRRPRIGDEMVVVVGREDRVGFRLVGEEEFEADPEGEQEDAGLTQGL